MSGRMPKFDAGLLLLAVIVALPMLWVAGYSLAYGFGLIGWMNSGLTFSHWQSALTHGGLPGAVALSAAVAATVTLVATAISLLAVLIRPGLRRQPLILALVCLAMGTPGAITAFMVYQLLSGGGLFARLAFHAGWIGSPADFPQLVNDRFAVGIIVAQVCGAVPLMLLYFSQLWTTIKADRLCALAEALGATLWQARLRVALPMLLHRGRSMIVLLFLLNLGSYETPLLLGRQSPQMFSVLTQRRSAVYDLSKRPETYVLATVYLALAVLLLVVYLQWRQRSE